MRKLHDIDLVYQSEVPFYVFHPFKLVEIKCCDHAFRVGLFVNTDTAAPFWCGLLIGGFLD